MYLNDNNNNNNNNNIIIIIIQKWKKKSIKVKLWEATEGERKRHAGDFFLLLLFLLFLSFSDLRKSNHRFSSGVKAKLIYAMRATREHQKVRVSTNSVR